ncbi:MFS transporter [Pseudomonas sp. gcc21]|uniref:MFS transporter n=1 Tax=Pseudomonas sp. gcc21 TaxID=2726989 RepID=UPI00145121BD|nr:MFS transporter [Pseudomonas sp. gcc21]QJD58253.1 MFS transporter [Pseudomonas sp. gcc21]
MRNTANMAFPGLALTTITVLYLAHSLPLYFFNVAVPAILREQSVDLRWIGMLSLLFLPWALKFLWAPYVDRFYVPRLGKRRTWIVFTQLAVLAGFLLLASVGTGAGILTFVLIALAISTLAATQDIAIDGYAIEAVARSQHSFSSSAQSVGVALGSMMGGAGSLWLYERYGWTTAVLGVAALIGFTMLAVLKMREGPAPTLAARLDRPSWARVLARPDIRRLLLVILVFRTVEAPAMAMLNPMLVDTGWSLTHIGLLFSVFGAGVGVLAAISAGWLVRRNGAVYWLLVCGWLRSVMYGLIAAMLLLGAVTDGLLAFGVLGILAIRYLTMTALYAHFMAQCSENQTATDFTVLVCFELLIYFLGASLSGFLAEPLGYGWFFALLGAASVVSVILTAQLMKTSQSVGEPNLERAI